MDLMHEYESELSLDNYHFKYISKDDLESAIKKVRRRKQEKIERDRWNSYCKTKEINNNETLAQTGDINTGIDLQEVCTKILQIALERTENSVSTYALAIDSTQTLNVSEETKLVSKTSLDTTNIRFVNKDNAGSGDVVEKPKRVLKDAGDVKKKRCKKLNVTYKKDGKYVYSFQNRNNLL